MRESHTIECMRSGVTNCTCNQPKVVHEWGNFRLLDNEELECCSGVVHPGKGQWRPILPGEWRGVKLELARLVAEVERLKDGLRLQEREMESLNARASQHKSEITGWKREEIIWKETEARLLTKRDALAERVAELEEAQSTAFEDGWAAHAKTTEVCEAANTRLRSAAATSIRKCEQYWNEHNIPDAEVHAALELIHGELRKALKGEA